MAPSASPSDLLYQSHQQLGDGRFDWQLRRPHQQHRQRSGQYCGGQYTLADQPDAGLVDRLAQSVRSGNVAVFESVEQRVIVRALAVAHPPVVGLVSVQLLWPFGPASARALGVSVAHKCHKWLLLLPSPLIAQLANLRTHPSVALELEQGRMNLHGCVYDIETGSIDALDGATPRFVPLGESPSTVAVASRNPGRCDMYEAGLNVTGSRGNKSLGEVAALLG